MKGALSFPFLRLYGLTLLYFGANSVLNVILPLKGQSLGATNTAIGIIMGAYLFTTMLFRPWAGLLIHRYGPIPVLRTILVVNGLALLLYTVTGLGGYLAARMLQGACTAFFSMALQLGIIDALPDRERSQGISMYSLVASVPGIFGPLLAVGMWQSGTSFWFAASMIAFALLTGVVGYTARMTPHAGKPTADQKKQGTEMLQSFGQLIRHPRLFRCSMLMLAASLVFGASTTFIPLYAPQVRAGHAEIYLLLQAGTLVATRWVWRKRIPSDGRWHTGYVVTVTLLIAAAAQAIGFAAAGGAAFFYTGALLLGVAQALLYPALTSYLSFVLPAASRNVLLGLFIAMADLGMSLGSIVMGPVADLVSYPSMYTICAILSVAMLFFAYERRASASEA
ncbi:MFS transporter [Cohnella sp. GbtcB17]|uniref:staphylopine family metallophore export MFS transporter CntE n=1 Tax=Cohnella sp. GbtcB17 TaxID=2824762 RepID=UPI001C30E4BF|nr:MFS transporter [Cohnella sp. GbtcB17]